MSRRSLSRGAVIAILFSATGCAVPAWKPPSHESVAPVTQPTASLALDSSQISPMYRQIVAIDLPTVVRVAAAQNLDIEQARQRLEAARGRYESSVEALLPVIAPTIAFQHLDGVNQAVNGELVPVNFDTFIPAISLQWILNPGRAVYDIVASKRRLEASQQQENSVLQETTRAAAVQYYDLVLAQSRLAVARQAVSEARELVRIAQLRVRAGTGLQADELRALAALAANEQDQATALFDFFQASLALGLTLHLDPTATLVPQPQQIGLVTLVREDIPIDELLATAIRQRSDLESLRTIMQAARADTKAAAWGGLGPQVQAGYSYGGVQSQTSGPDFSLHEQQRASAGAGFALDAATFGRIKTASANERLASLEAMRQLDRVRASVVSAQQASITHSRIIPAARQQVELAEEALRLAQANLQAGTMLTLDVLQAQRAVDDARMRYSDAVIRYNQSQVNLLASIGIMDEAGLFPETALPSTSPTRELIDGNASD